jgi:hypothetical protein
MLTYTQCSWATLTARASNPFGNAPSVGGQGAGSVPFGTGSQCCCTNNGPGDGSTFGGSGLHCFDNINDDLDGNDFGWYYTELYTINNKSFVGVRFPGRRKIRGIRISRDVTGTNDNRYSKNIYVYITSPDTVPSPTFTTSPSLWQCVGIIPPRSNKGYFWYEFPTVVEASGIILEFEFAEELQRQCIDELKVYARVSAWMCACVAVYAYLHPRVSLSTCVQAL